MLTAFHSVLTDVHGRLTSKNVPAWLSFICIKTQPLGYVLPPTAWFAVSYLEQASKYAPRPCTSTGKVRKMTVKCGPVSLNRHQSRTCSRGVLQFSSRHQPPRRGRGVRKGGGGQIFLPLWGYF